MHLGNHFYWGGTALALRTHPCILSLLEVVTHSFQTNFCKERDFPREITKVFSVLSLTYWAAVKYKVQYRVCKGPNTSRYFENCSITSPMMTLWQQDRPHDGRLSNGILSQQSFLRRFCSPLFMYSANVWLLCGTMIEVSLQSQCRSPAFLLGKLWQLPLHFWPLLGNRFKTPVCSSLFYNQLS